MRPLFQTGAIGVAVPPGFTVISRATVFASNAHRRASLRPDNAGQAAESTGGIPRSVSGSRGMFTGLRLGAHTIPRSLAGAMTRLLVPIHAFEVWGF